MNSIHLPKRIVVAFFLLLAFSSCAISIGQNDIKAEREDTLLFETNNDINTLKIDSYNGRITLISNQDSSIIQGSAETWAYADNEEQAQKRLAKISWNFTQKGRTLVLRLSGSNGGSNIKTLSVPANWNLDLNTENGRIEISKGFKSITAQSNNGAINIEGGHDVEAETSNGKITYSGSAERFHLESANGRISIQLDGNWNGSGKASSSNGNISLICSGIIDARLTSFSNSSEPYIYGPGLSGNRGKGELSLVTGNGSINIAHSVSIL